jgi:hypothetical protein
MSGNKLEGETVHKYDETIRFKYLRISNQEKLSGTPNVFRVSFGNDPRLGQVCSVRVVSAMIPNTGYNISPEIGNQRIIINFTLAGLYDTTIPAGFYNIGQLITYLTTDINAVIFPNTISILQDPITQRLTFTVTGAEQLQIVGGPSFPYANNSTLAPFLGATDLLIGPATSLTVPSFPNLRGDTMFYVHCNQIANNSTYLNSGMNILDVNGLISIPVNAPWGAVQTYLGKDYDRIIYGMNCKSINEFDISLYRNHGRLLDLDPNEEATIVLKFTFSPHIN